MKEQSNMWRVTRLKHGKTLKDVADAIGCSKQYVSYMEQGKRRKIYKYQIYILELRGEEIDLINAKYLRERLLEDGE